MLGAADKRRRGKSKMRFMDVVREDMRVVGVSDRDTARRNWRLRIRCGDPQWEQPKGKEGDTAVPETTYILDCSIVEAVNQQVVTVKIDDALRSYIFRGTILFFCCLMRPAT